MGFFNKVFNSIGLNKCAKVENAVNVEPEDYEIKRAHEAISQHVNKQNDGGWSHERTDQYGFRIDIVNCNRFIIIYSQPAMCGGGQIVGGDEIFRILA